MPYDVTVTPGKFDAAAVWQGEATVYNVRYRVSGTERWAEQQVTGTSFVIGGLESSTTYEFAVQSVCSKADGDTSAFTVPVLFTTLAETCLPPASVTVVSASETAVVTWQGEAGTYEVGCTDASGVETLSKTVENSVTLAGLSPETEYKVRVRAICAVGDTSRWTEYVAFSTLPLAECVTPYDLAVGDITDNSAILSWSADEGNTGWNLRWRESTVTSWTDVTGLDTRSYLLSGLKANTVYIWRVQAACEGGRTSGWATQNKFTTLTADGIGDTGIDDIRIFVKGKTLNVVNPSGGVIKSIRVYNAAGQMLGSFTVNTSENVFIPMTAEGSVIVKVYGERLTRTEHVVIE